MRYQYLALAIVTSSALFLGGCTKKDPSAPQTINEQISESKQLADAIKNGQPTYCVMTKGQDKMEYWIKGKMFKMQGITTMQDEESGKTTEVENYVISDSSYMYSWSNQNKQGFKMKIPTDLPAEASAKEGQDQSEYEKYAPKFDNEQGYESLKNEGYTINCQKTDIKDSDFATPTDINFVDPTEMMKAVSGQNGQIDMQKLQDMAKQYEGMDN